MKTDNDIVIIGHGELFNLKAEHWIPSGIAAVWDFFSSPDNLPLITPPELDFKILTDCDEHEIFDGMIIDYKVRPLLGISVHWQTRICKVVKEKMFVDEQLKGPYKIWQHQHQFTEQNGGVMMTDEVNYKLPFGFLGKMMHSILVKQKLENIFKFRRVSINKIFP